MLILSLLLSIILTTAVNHNRGMLCRFRNIANYDIVLWWITPYQHEELRFFGHLRKNGGMVSFTANPGSKFLWAPPNKENDKSKRSPQFQITADKILYLYTDSTNPADQHTLTQTEQELHFLSEYYSKNNRHWLSTYGRPKPIQPFIHSFRSNQKLTTINSNNYFWKCDPIKKKYTTGTPTIASRITRLFSSTRPKNLQKISPCQNNNKPLQFTIEKLHDHRPQIYKISNFISEYEAKHIINLSLTSMHRSTTGNGKNQVTDPTRTSTNTWLSMNRTEVVETVYKRIGDVLGIDAYKMTVEATLVDEAVASHMEVVHFDTNEFYARHFDNAVGNDIYFRFITFQVILKVSEDLNGGKTAFIEAEGKNGETEYFPVDSEEYSAVFWYNILDDGNLDETSMYSNEMVRKGDQWMFHIHVWDPSLPIGGDPSMPNELMFKTEL